MNSKNARNFIDCRVEGRMLYVFRKEGKCERGATMERDSPAEISGISWSIIRSVLYHASRPYSLNDTDKEFRAHHIMLRENNL
ncbi:hypothetical protein HYZ97_04110 [Candidatus Pacearchaeota archaeon]|nr:hypothetical protein [Candidatus Pacearchaeota archaeon]